MTSKELRLFKTPQRDGLRAKKQAAALLGSLCKFLLAPLWESV
jgi:hypothetical protein